ncbi:MAG TPA: winged helix-turn-helix domain-containing protein [Gammaproteobacteria bacterium]|nr:winged helix-turn-helix domain-containing protein [Gammaproteobacteria bacterium]
MELERGFRIGRWDVYPLRNVVSRADASLRLEAKSIQVLMVLARRPGEVVTRKDLLEDVWQDRPVSDEVLSRCVSLLRSTLGDDPKDPAYIQTIPRIGYRLIAPVRPLGEHHDEATAAPDPAVPLEPAPPETPQAPPETPQAPTPPTAEAARGTGRPGLYLLLAAATIALAVILLSPYLSWLGEGRQDPATLAATHNDAIAVLPFRNLSADPDDEYFADGLTDELISRLSGLEGLKVIARTTALAFKGSAEDARSIGARLGVSHLVTGTVRISQSRLRVTVQLVETGRGLEISSKVYDATIADAFAVQHDVSLAIASALLPTLQQRGGGGRIAELSAIPDAKAYLLLLRARHLIKRREAQSIGRAIGLLDEAIAMDPGQAPLYLALAKAHALLPYYSREPMAEMFVRAEQIIDAGRASGAPIGDTAEGLAAFIALGRREWLKADAHFQKALDAEPSDADLYQWRSEFYASVGRVDLSLTHAIRASELDALSPVVNDRLAVAYLWLDEDERARRLFEDASLLGLGMTANPGAYLISLMRAAEYNRAGRLLHTLQTLLGGPTDWIAPLMAAQSDPASKDEAVAAVSRAAATDGIEPRFLFGAWVYLGEHERAMAHAEQMLDTESPFDVEFLFARENRALRSHPRFGVLLEKIGVDRYWDQAGWPSWCRRDGGGIACDPGSTPFAARP